MLENLDKTPKFSDDVRVEGSVNKRTPLQDPLWREPTPTLAQVSPNPVRQHEVCEESRGQAVGREVETLARYVEASIVPDRLMEDVDGGGRRTAAGASEAMQDQPRPDVLLNPPRVKPEVFLVKAESSGSCRSFSPYDSRSTLDLISRWF